MTLLKQTVSRITPQDETFRKQAKRRLDQLTMPHWALGRLMDLAMDLAGMTRSLNPPVARRVVVTMAADHGVAAEGVSQYPQEVTRQMVLNFLRGGAGINAMARVVRANVVVVDMGVAAEMGDIPVSESFFARPVRRGTRNMVKGPAMSREEALRCVETGIEIAQTLSASYDLFATGEMGIGNTTPSSAIVAVMTGSQVPQVTGHGTGINEQRFFHKIEVIEKALAVNQPNSNDALDVLAKVGGFEIGGLAGLMLGVASRQKPVLVDGFISTAAALIAQGLAPAVTDYLIAAHRSVEQGHQAALARLGKKPLMDLDLRLGEGTGAALAMALVEASVRILTEVATFEEAGVSEADT